MRVTKTLEMLFKGKKLAFITALIAFAQYAEAQEFAGFTGGQYQIQTNNIPRFRLDNTTGNIGIGKDPNSTYKLDVGGEAGFRSTSYFYGPLYSYDASSGNYMRFQIAGNIGYIGMYNANNPLALQISGGNLGIGTATPKATLDVNGNMVLGSNNDPYLFLGPENALTHRYLGLLNGANGGTAGGLKVGGLLVANSYSYANPSRQDMVVQGSVAIGKSTASHALDVAGTVNASQVITPSVTFDNNNSIYSPTISTMEFNLDGDTDSDLQLAGDLWLNFYTTRQKFYFGSSVVFGQPTLSTYFNRTLTLELDQGMSPDPNISFTFSASDGNLRLASNRSKIAFENPVLFDQGFETIGSIIAPNITFNNNNNITSPTISTMEFNLDGDADMDLRLAGDLWLNFSTTREKFYFGNGVVLGHSTLSTYFNPKLTLELDQGMSPDPNISFEYSTGDGNLHLASNMPKVDFDSPVVFNQYTGFGADNPSIHLHVKGAGSPIGDTQFHQKIESTGSKVGLSFSNNTNGGVMGYANMGTGPKSNLFYVTTGAGTINSGFVMDNDGKIGVGTLSPTQKLTVDGKINAEEVILENVTGADFVFEEDYDLRSLEETEEFIKANKHLPEVPSAAEMAEEGLAMKDMNILLLQKVEELTLHLIEKDKEVKELQSEMVKIREQLEKIKEN